MTRHVVAAAGFAADNGGAAVVRCRPGHKAPRHGRKTCRSRRGRRIPSKWLSGTATNGTVRAFKCKPEACSDPTTVVFTFQKGSFTPPSPAALEKFATVDLPKSIRAAAAARAVMSGVVERIETLASAPTVLQDYPSVVNETKFTRDGTSSVYVDTGIIFAGPIIIKVESRSPSRELAQKVAERVRGRHEDRRSAGAGEARSRGAAPAQDRKPVRLHKR